jgi:hypothetical protein
LPYLCCGNGFDSPIKSEGESQGTPKKNQKAKGKGKMRKSYSGVFVLAFPFAVATAFDKNGE